MDLLAGTSESGLSHVPVLCSKATADKHAILLPLGVTCAACGMQNRLHPVQHMNRPLLNLLGSDSSRRLVWIGWIWNGLIGGHN